VKGDCKKVNFHLSDDPYRHKSQSVCYTGMTKVSAH